MTRNMSALGRGMQPVRALFAESRIGNRTDWTCRLCPFVYYEIDNGDRWPITVSGLLLLTKHLRGHLQA